MENDLQALLLGAEFGYKAREEGKSLEQTLHDVRMTAFGPKFGGSIEHRIENINALSMDARAVMNFLGSHGDSTHRQIMKACLIDAHRTTYVLSQLQSRGFVEQVRHTMYWRKKVTP